MLRYRLPSFFLLLCLLAALFYLDFCHTELGRIFFTILAAAAVFPAAAEFTAMLNRSGIITRHFSFAGFLCCSVLCISAFFPAAGHGGGLFAAGCILVMLLWASLLKISTAQDSCRKNAGTAAVFLFITLLVLPLWIIHESGPQWFLFFVLATKACDTGGYIAGMLSNKLMKNGNHKLIPAISPKKSWEGLAGGIILSLTAGLCFGVNDILHIGLWQTLMISFLLCLGSLAGDLSESALKRSAGIKDSGSWIPGMGGILDVADSFIYNGPVLALFLTASGI